MRRYALAGLAWMAAATAWGEPVKISERFGFDPADSTRFIQQALDSGLPEIMLDDKGAPWITCPLKGRSNQVLYFADGVVLQAKKGEFRGKDDILLCYRHATNIAVVGMGRSGGTIRMHKADYLQPPYERAEWRHAIHIGNTSSFRIENMLLAESGGDGIEIYGTACSNGVIRRVTCDANCRQGISVCSAKHLLIEDCVLTNTKGLPPEAGIDFEPDKPNHELTDIVMRNCRVTGNAGNGIEFFTGCSCSKTVPFSVTVADCVVVSNNISARVGGGRWKRDNYPQGRITYTNCLFEASRRYAVSVDAKPVEAYVVEFLGCTAKDTNGGEAGTDVRLLNYAENGVHTGGVVFRDCTFHQDSDRPWAKGVEVKKYLPEAFPGIEGDIRTVSPDGKVKELKLSVKQPSVL